MSIKIGITGVAGSGKTTICNFMEEVYNIPIFYSDIVCKELISTNRELQRDLIKYDPELFINGKYNTILAFDNLITNPDRFTALFIKYILEEFHKFCKNKPIVAYESAILWNNYSVFREFDHTITIYANLKDVVERLLKRGWDEYKIISILNIQKNNFKYLDCSRLTLNTSDPNSIINLTEWLTYKKLI